MTWKIKLSKVNLFSFLSGLEVTAKNENFKNNFLLDQGIGIQLKCR